MLPTNRVYALQGSPVLEPHQLISGKTCFRAERLHDERFDLLPCFSCEIAIAVVRIFFEQEFGPDHDVGDFRLKSIWPVVPQDLVVVWIGEMRIRRRCGRVPMKSFMLYELQDRSVSALQIIDVLKIASQIARDAFK